MAILHQILSDDPRAWRDCGEFCRPGDTVVLVDAGAGLLADDDFMSGFPPVSGIVGTVALEADVVARGLHGVADKAGIELLGDVAWVRLACSREMVWSWK